MENVYLSVVIPLYNEEDNVEELHERLDKVLSGIKKEYEIILVEDGSKDGTYKLLEKIREKDENVRLIKFRKNYGQTASIQAGFDYAEGEIIITMDGDLQHFPEEIPSFIEKMEEGYDIVSGWRKNRVDNFILRRLPSMIANKLMAILSGIDLHDFGTTFKAYRKNIVKGIDLYGELHRFIPALASWQGVKIYEIPIKNVVRGKGKSSYGLSRTFRVMFDLILVKFLLKYIARPLHLFGGVGVIFCSAGFLIGLIITLMYYFGNLVIRDHLGNLMFASLCMMLGVQLIAMGLSLEMATRIYYKTSNRKIYAVEKIV